MRVQQAATAITGSESRLGRLAKAPANNEHLLIAQAKSGRSSAFGELYERHLMRVYQSAFRILRNPHDAEDATQRCFQRAFTNLSTFRGDSAFSTWLTRIAINEALMLLRQRRTSIRLFEGNSDGEYGSSAFDLADKGPTPEEIFAENELRALMIQTISQLRESLRSVALRQLQGLTTAETARQLGLTVTAVKARGFHAKRYLRRYIELKLGATRISCCPKTFNACWTLFGSAQS